MENPYKVVVFDLDGVIFDKPSLDASDENVAISSWDVLFDTLGIYDLHEKLKRIFTNKGFKSYVEWTDAACCVLKAKCLDKETFQNVINSRPLIPGAVETFKILEKNKIATGVVSGSFEALALRVKKELGIDNVLAHCKLEFDERGILKDWKLLATDYKDKIKFVKYMAQINKVGLNKCVYVGDDVNDVPVFNIVGLSIAFNCNKKKVLEAADVVIEEKDLTKILPHLGIS